MTRYRFLSWSLTKYMAREVIFTFVAGTSIFLLLMLMFQAIRLAEFVVVQQVAMHDVLRLCLYLMLTFLPLALPIAFLFAVLMGISRANSEGEITALLVTGISRPQIFTPVLMFSAIITAICLYCSLYTVPQGNRSFELLYTRLANEKVMAALRPSVFVNFHGLVLFAEEIVPIKNELKRVFISDERDEKTPLAITAEAGILRNIPEKNMLTLRLSNGAIHVDKKRLSPVQQKIEFEVYDINLNLAPKGDSWRDYSPPSYTYPQLRQRLAETEHDETAHRKIEIELQRRFSLSFSCIVFAMLGFTIGTLSFRGIRSTAIILCLAVGLVYWIAYVAANALAGSGLVSPWLGIWAPNFLFTGVAAYCARRR